MKKIINLICLLYLSSSLALAANEAITKKEVLAACSKQAKQAPTKKMQKILLDACKCTVENTDFEKVKSLEQNKDQKGLQQLLIEVANKCRNK